MTHILLDTNAGRSASRPTSPGRHLWWDRLRGASDLAAPTRLGRSEEGSADLRTATLPALYEPPIEERDAYLRALGRTVNRIRQQHP